MKFSKIVPILIIFVITVSPSYAKNITRIKQQGYVKYQGTRNMYYKFVDYKYLGEDIEVRFEVLIDYGGSYYQDVVEHYRDPSKHSRVDIEELPFFDNVNSEKAIAEMKSYLQLECSENITVSDKYTTTIAGKKFVAVKIVSESDSCKIEVVLGVNVGVILSYYAYYGYEGRTFQYQLNETNIKDPGIMVYRITNLLPRFILVGAIIGALAVVLKRIGR